MADSKRREFIKTGAKMGALALGTGLAGTGLLNGAESRAKSKMDSKNSKDSKSAQNSAKNTKGDNMNAQVWYITGASGGLGLALAKYLLAKGDKVAGTSRSLKNIESKLGKESENFLPLELKFEGNLDKNIKANIAAIERKFGRLDNVVNNAGYGLLGYVEETSEKQLREQFEVNVFAPFLIVQNALKIMRPQAKNEGGNATNIKARIFNLSSIGGFRVSNASTPYCMSKFAISALSEGLNLDLADFGIATINIMPGGFRTEFVGTSMVLGDIKIKDYDAQRADFEARMKAYNGKQAGNPEKFAEILHKLSREANPPQNIFMGQAAYNSARNKIAAIENYMKITEPYAGKAADFSDAGDSAFDKR